ncbi:hypothetical protein T484DRAFT_1819704 [Baffinella frigidus]|nr:hypothetical protein T484DRAFT_1819704 [Cryptophyta sp. CCMP2293]
MQMLRLCLSFMVLAQAAAWMTTPGGAALRVLSGRGSVKQRSSRPSTKEVVVGRGSILSILRMATEEDPDGVVLTLVRGLQYNNVPEENAGLRSVP